MRQSRFTEAQIIGMIKEQEAGMPTAEVCQRHGLSPASSYKFKAKYGGMNVSDICLERCGFVGWKPWADIAKWGCPTTGVVYVVVCQGLPEFLTENPAGWFKSNRPIGTACLILA